MLEAKKSPLITKKVLNPSLHHKDKIINQN